jgi:FkbM family methyltransferase
MSYVSKFSTRRFNIILIKFLSKILSIIDLNLELVPYSNWSSSIFLIYKKQNKKSFRLQKQNYFNFNIFSQESDLRAIFPNYWDEESTRIASLFSLSKLYDEFDFFDIGANYGLYSLPFLKSKKIGCHLIVEPNPFLITCLEKTFEKSKVKIISNALTACNKKKKLLFNIKPFGSGSSSLETSTKIKSPPPLSNLQLNVNNIGYRDMFRKYKTKKNVIIKIDIEGTEVNLLKNGLLDYLNRTYQNFIIMIEYVPKLYNRAQNNLFKKKLLNYHCITLTNTNFKSEVKYNNYKRDFLLKENSINRFYKSSCHKGIEHLVFEKNFLYSDILIFSSKKLAKQALSLN